MVVYKLTYTLLTADVRQVVTISLSSKSGKIRNTLRVYGVGDD